MHMSVLKIYDNEKTYAPFHLPSQACTLLDGQARSIHRKNKVWPDILYKKDWGIWVGSTCTRQCRHAEHEVYHV